MIDNSDNIAAIASESVKEACLFFKNVIPICFPHDFHEIDEEIRNQIFDEILPPSLRYNDERHGMGRFFFNTLFDKSFYHNLIIRKNYLSEENVIKKESKKATKKKNRTHPKDDVLWESVYANAVKKILEVTEEKIIGTFGRPEIYEEPLNSLSDISLALSGMKLIDVTTANWEKIIEFRKDKNSIEAVRRFRNYINGNLFGKNHHQIEDNILSTIESYKKVIDEWMFDTKTAALECVFSEKILSSVLTTGVATLFGAPLSVCAAAGAVVELGQIGISIARKRRELYILKKYDPVSYIVQANEINRENKADIWIFRSLFENRVFV